MYLLEAESKQAVEQVNQVAKAIKKIAGDATRDNFNALANPDGYKHIGRSDYPPNGTRSHYETKSLWLICRI
ncbi:hypothetical protein [Mannheimia haemolytica]|uniref:hypothetical protein n=1 Tax=Mannheimia haemolytica TaxID=75985 RepID=UPI0031F52317